MWRHLLYILPLILSAVSIKVPVENKEGRNSDAYTENPTKNDQTYHVPEDSYIDSYLIPPDPHKVDEELADVLVTPATYLLPPSPEIQIDYYYASTEPGEQSEWYPIAQNNAQSQKPELEPLPILIANDNHYKRGQVIDVGRVIPVPSTHLEPPLVNAPNDYLISTPSEELQLPLEEIDHIFRVPPPVKTHKSYREGKTAKNVYSNHLPLNYRPKNEEPILAVHLTPPKAEFSYNKTPTKLYPKKVSGGFKPIPIPIAQFAEDSIETPRAKPLKYFKPADSAEDVYLSPVDEKKIYLYQNAEQKRKLKGENQAVKQQQLGEIIVEDTNVEQNPKEQQASESNYRYPERNTYPAPLRQAPPAAPKNANTAPAPDERTEFRMHGMKGPHSYQFGYDTGKGKNRQFRYEERDNEGIVQGHYGYMEKDGKLRVVNYSAHPEHGFHAEAPVDKE